MNTEYGPSKDTETDDVNQYESACSRDSLTPMFQSCSGGSDIILTLFKCIFTTHEMFLDFAAYVSLHLL